MKRFFKGIKIIVFILFVVFSIRVILDFVNEDKKKSNKSKKKGSNNGMKKVKAVRKVQTIKKPKIASNMSRIEKLRIYMQDVKSADMSDVRKIFPSVTERTLRRDFNKLVDQGFVTKTGNTKSSRYVIKS